MSTAKPIPVKKLVSCPDFVGSTSAKITVDQIWTYDQREGWSKYYYYKRGSTAKWCAEDTTTELTDDVTVAPGVAIFFVRASGAEKTTLTFAGGVVDLSAEKTVSVASGETKIICNPWPTDIKIKDFSKCYAEGSTPVGSTSAKITVDQVWLYDQTAGWSKYYFYKRGSTEKWCAEETTTEVGDNIVISGGKGFFFVRASGADSADLTFKGPEAK